MVNIISAVQFIVPIAHLPNEGLIKNSNNIGFLQRRTSKELFSCELLEYTDDICLP